MLSLNESLATQARAGLHKAQFTARPAAFLVATMLGGAFIGLADILMFTAAGPFFLAGHPATALVQGLVFGIGLILVVFAGGELATSAMMALPQAVGVRALTWPRAASTLALILVGNLLGCLVLALVVWGTGVFDAGTAPGDMLAAVAAGKAHKSTLALFTRGIMCNVLVCLAIWSQARTAHAVGKMLLMAWCLVAFVTSGFEHVVANMTTLSLAWLEGVEAVTLAEMARNYVVVGAGNLVGGAVFVGGAYLLVANRTAAAKELAEDVH
ncbi:formate/nitrite transporter family protein [Buchananella hordeovulneris]|uniref:Formate/nitrite transporter n=1 Tax=Buchananella hordeovulneris TaxID=52770 RepID=A0A1Q5PUP7_9ACTO|nr:formate/nitrite transporter family protein [Buchananella hordeovulneris]MDO5081340.1 formate/nitrite transporter family protein [Buchananella hordeovulneris]OKL51323.1 formate/nitrite transporter [Buchananella hordeovulneris]RRD42189.1 formate/nitrite transporter family protein [Buchananella hordeovulneris]RRD51285.1 formate/nitrite transporter family protein [Buchananella hordeovulneris]